MNPAINYKQQTPKNVTKETCDAQLVAKMLYGHPQSSNKVVWQLLANDRVSLIA